MKEKKAKERVATISDHKEYYIPHGDEILIPKIHLEKQLGKYKTAIESTVNIGMIFSVITLWLPVVNSDFKGVFGLSKDIILAVYVAFCVISTIPLCKPLFVYFGKLFYKPWGIAYETDPEKRAENIIGNGIEK